jgi:hypothetical protein
VGEAWPPCRVVGISVFIGTATGVFANAPLEQGIDNCVCVLRMFSHGEGVRGVAQACSGPRLLVWHNVGDDGAAHDGFFRFLSQFVVL